MKPVHTSTSLAILLVEDHEDSRYAISRWFECNGYSVIAAGSKESAIAMGRNNHFDVLICDLQLPDGDGTEVMTTLALEKRFVGVAVSGHAAPRDLARTKNAGFLMHVTKPFCSEELDAALASVRRELERRSGSNAPQPGAPVSSASLSTTA